MNEQISITLLFGQMVLDFHSLHKEYSNWVKNKFKGIANPPDKDGICGLGDFNYDIKKYNVVSTYLTKCQTQNLSKIKFFEECISNDFENIPIYHQLKKDYDEVLTKDNTKLRRIVADIVAANPRDKLEELLVKAREATSKEIDVRTVRATIIAEIRAEQDALSNIVQQIIERGISLSEKYNKFLSATEKHIQSIDERLK